MDAYDRKTADFNQPSDAEKLAAAEQAIKIYEQQLADERTAHQATRDDRDAKKAELHALQVDHAAAQQRIIDLDELVTRLDNQLQAALRRVNFLTDNRLWDIGGAALVSAIVTALICIAIIVARSGNNVPKDALTANQIGLAHVTGQLYATQHERDHLLAANADLQARLASASAQAAQNAADASKGNTTIVNTLPGYRTTVNADGSVDNAPDKLDILRALIPTGPLSATVNLQGNGANCTNPAAGMTDSIWLGAFDSGAFAAAGIQEINVLSTPAGGEPGFFTYETATGNDQTIHYLNARAVIDNQTGAAVSTPGKYRVVSRELFTGANDGETTQNGNLSRLYVEYIGQ